MGRPEGTGYHPTPEQRQAVELMAAFGIPENEMVVLVINPKSKKPISPHTLRAHFRTELDRGLIQANVKVIGAMFKNATTPTTANPGGNPIIQMFWAKTRMRWQDRVSIGLDPVAPPDGATEDEVKTDYEWARRIAYTLSLAAAGPPPSTKSSDKKKQTV